MKKPHNKSSGDSSAPGSSLIGRLADRASGKPGVVDTNHPRAVYGRTAGWIADHFPLLSHLKNRYDAGDGGYQQGQSLVMGRSLGAAEDAPEFAHTVPSSSRIAGGGDDPVSQSKSSDPSPTTPVTYRVSRRPSYQTLKIDRATLGPDPLARSAGVERGNSITELGPQHSVAPVVDTSLNGGVLPVSSGDPESREPIGRPEMRPVKSGPASSPGNDDSGGSTSSPRGSVASESRSLAPRGPGTFPPQDQARQVSSVIVQRQNDLILLKRDNEFPSPLEHREAPPASVTGISSSPALDAAIESHTPNADRQPGTGTAPIIALEIGGSAAPPIHGHQSTSGDLIVARSRTAAKEPALREIATGKTGAVRAPKPGEGTNWDFLATNEDSRTIRVPNPTDAMGSTVEDGSASIGSRPAGFDVETIGREPVAGSGEPLILRKARIGAGDFADSEEAAHSDDRAMTVQLAPHAAVLGARQEPTAPSPSSEAINGQAVPRTSAVASSGEPLVLRKARIGAGEFAASEEAGHSDDMTITAHLALDPAVAGAHQGPPPPRPSSEGKSRQVAPVASSPAATHAAGSTSSLPLAKPQTLPAVQRKRTNSNQAAARGFGTDSGSVIAREIRLASHQIEIPNIVWRQSVSAPTVGRSPGADTRMMLNASGSTSATSAERSSSSGSPNNSQSWTAPEANQSPSIDVGRITEQIIHAIRRRLELERERRGMGR